MDGNSMHRPHFKTGEVAESRMVKQAVHPAGKKHALPFSEKNGNGIHAGAPGAGPVHWKQTHAPDERMRTSDALGHPILGDKKFTVRPNIAIWNTSSTDGVGNRRSSWCSNLTCYKHKSCTACCLTCYTAHRILFHARIQNRVGNCIADFVRVSFCDGLRCK